jgi:hypothetical protein
MTATRWIAGLILLFLLDAVQLLWLVPDRTDELWAWEIQPELTSMVLASAYAAGAYFFGRVLFGASWREVAPGFPGVIVFVWMAAAATFLHLDRFIEDNLAFAAWIALYTVTPIAIPLLYVYNERRAPQREAPSLAGGLRLGLACAGAAVIGIGLAMMLSPSTAQDVWPWTLTPLTARILSAVVALYGAVWAAVAADGTRTGARIPLESHAIGLVVLLAALVRESEVVTLVAAGAAAMLVVDVAVVRAVRRARSVVAA